MDVNYLSNRILSSRANPSFYSGSTNRQYGSGLGSALRLGLKSFVIPLAKRYGLPLAKNLVQSAAPEVLGIIEGRTKPKSAMKKTLRETVKNKLEVVAREEKEREVQQKGATTSVIETLTENQNKKKDKIKEKTLPIPEKKIKRLRTKNDQKPFHKEKACLENKP